MGPFDFEQEVVAFFNGPLHPDGTRAQLLALLRRCAAHERQAGREEMRAEAVERAAVTIMAASFSIDHTGSGGWLESPADVLAAIRAIGTSPERELCGSEEDDENN